MRSLFPCFAVVALAGAALAPGCRCSDDPKAEAPAPAKSALVTRLPLGRRLPKTIAIPPRLPPAGSGAASSDPPPPQAPTTR